MDGTLPFRRVSFSIFQHVGLRFLHGHASVSSYYVSSFSVNPDFNGFAVFCHIVVFQFEPTHKSNLGI